MSNEQKDRFYWSIIRPILQIGSIAALSAYVFLTPSKSPPRNEEFEEGKYGQYDLIYSDDQKREFAGKMELGYRGASQDIYVDKKPFGTLDEIRIKYFSDSHTTNEYVRVPNDIDRGRFDIIEYLGKKNHPARNLK